MDLQLSLEYIVENPDQAKKLANALDTANASIKKQIFELLGALCAYNSDGYNRALEVLEHYKKTKDERYRFKFVVDELRSGKDLDYLSSIASFVNYSIISIKSLKERIRTRNEYLGLKISDAISQLRITFSDNECDLLIQLDIFEEQRLADECQLTGPNGVDLSSHQDVFYAILRQVSSTPQEFPFLNILQHLLRIDASLMISDIIWDTAEKLVHRATLCETKEDLEKLLRAPSYHHSLNKLLRSLQESGGRCPCSCHARGEGVCCGNDCRTRKRTPLQLSFSTGDGCRTPGILSPSNSSVAFNPDLLASLSRAISPPPRGSSVPPFITSLNSTSGVPPPHPPPPPPPGLPPPPPPPPPSFPPPPPPPPGTYIPSTKPTSTTVAEQAIKLPQQSTPKPKNKMKTFNWTKIPSNKVVGKNNLWSLIAKVHDGSPNNLDFETIEGLFCQQSNLMNGQASPRLGAKNGRDSLDRKKRESSEINLLDGKRSLNVSIFLKQFRSSNDEIIGILNRGAHDEIGAEKLRGLLKILPESDEIELLRGYNGERARLGNAEKFLLQLIDLPSYKLRCEGMLLKEEFATNMAYIEPAIESIESAVEELKYCQELHEVLYMLLVAGNFLNSGGYAGDAAGFKMMSLLKVTEIRANKPGMNFIHYVVQEIENKFPILLKFPDLLPSLEEASKLSIENLRSEIANLSSKVNKIFQQVTASDDDIRKQMEEFLKFATKETAAVQKEIENLEKVRVDMAEFLCEDLQSFKLEECFKIFQNFCQKFKAAIEDNEARRQNEKKAAERKKQREKQVLKKKNSGENRPPSFSGSEPDNVIEMLLGDIRGGFSRFGENGSLKSRSKPKRVSPDGSGTPVELSRMNSLTSSVPSEEDPTPSPKVVRRRIGSSNSVVNGSFCDIDGTDTQSPDITPNGTLRRRRSRLSSEDREDNLMDYLRSTAEADRDKSKLSDGGSLDRSWFRRSARRRRPEILNMELNDRERPASPGPSPLLERKATTLEPLPSEANKPKQWRLKIEEWLQENEKEQQREKKLRDKIALERLRRQEMEQRESETTSQTDDKNEELKANKNLATLHEVKTDSEIYANKVKNSRLSESALKSSEINEGIALKDKSKWRKSNLNVANSSESIDDERRRSRGRKTVSDPDIDDTIRFYIRKNSQSSEILPSDRKDGEFSYNFRQSNEETHDTLLIPSSNKSYTEQITEKNVISDVSNDNIKRTEAFNQTEEKKSTKGSLNEVDPGITLGKSRFYQSMKEPPSNKLEPTSSKNVVCDDKMSNKGLPNKNTDCKTNHFDEESKNTSSEKDEEGNFDRFSYMRKTTRRSKSRNKPLENEMKRSDNHLEKQIVNKFQDLERVSSSLALQNSVKGVENKENSHSKVVEEAMKEINQSSKEIQNLTDEKLRDSGNAFTKAVGDCGKILENCDESRKKDKSSTSLKARLSRRLLSLTENLKVAKPFEYSDSADSQVVKSAIEDKIINAPDHSSNPEIEKIFNDGKTNLIEEKQNSILDHRMQIPLQSREDVAEISNKVTSKNIDCSSVAISQPQFIKESYVASRSNVKIVHATPVTHDIKELEPYPVQRVKEECEKDEGFEETQSQLSEAASQGAGSNYDTDLADSPRSVRQGKETANVTHSKGETKLSAESTDDNALPLDRTSIDLVKEVDRKETPPFKHLALNSHLLSRSQSMRSGDPRNPSEKFRSSLTSFTRLQNSKSDLDKKKRNLTSSTISNLQENKNKQIKSQFQGHITNSSNRIGKKANLKELSNVNETSPKIGKRVAVYTKAIKSMTNNLRGSKKFENYDVTQSMPPTPSEEKKTFASGLNLTDNGKKTQLSSSVYNLRSHSRRSSERSINSNIATPSRRGSEKSISSKRSSDKSLNLSRKSSETSVVTVKSASKKGSIPTSKYFKSNMSNSNQLSTQMKSKAKPFTSKNSVQTKQLHIAPTMTQSNPITKSTSQTSRLNTTVKRKSNDKSCSFMKATSASSAKTSPVKLTLDLNKPKAQNSQRISSKSITRIKPELSHNRIKQK